MTTDERIQRIQKITETAPINPMIHECEEQIEKEDYAFECVASNTSLDELSSNMSQLREKILILTWVKEDLLSKVDVIDHNDFDLYKIMDDLFDSLYGETSDD